jgi:hypothetical protein
MTKPASPDMIDRWRNKGLRQVTLPSLTRMKIRIPSGDMLVRSGAMPQDLRALAIQFATAGIELEKLDETAIDQFLKMKNVLIAWAVREIYTGEAEFTERLQDDDPDWQPISISADEIDDAELDGDDLGALAAIVMRQRTPNQVTAAVWQDEGKLDRRTLDNFLKDEAPTVGSFRGDRGGAGSADAGGEREPVGLPPESDGRARSG